ncbi:DUF1883 domain-containing protein [Microvirgula aerodenitrificans]|uniref:DUF1883 domain-containing protein n=1 Tax=Microvirgula aerodenitrificans TaxID=57480 RepID=UPI00248F29D1|nr:DUF1883 domain-containing protein [Microvirgula aerodenitrificans]
MEFFHQRRSLNPGDAVVVRCSHKSKVKLIDDPNFRAFESGRRYQYLGDETARLETRLLVPNGGNWNIVIDLSFPNVPVTHSVQVFQAAASYIL